MGYAVLRLFYVIDKAEADGINSAHTSSTRGSRGVSPWHTTLLARYSVLYLPATGVRKRGSARWGKAPTKIERAVDSKTYASMP